MCPSGPNRPTPKRDSAMASPWRARETTMRSITARSHQLVSEPLDPSRHLASFSDLQQMQQQARDHHSNSQVHATRSEFQIHQRSRDQQRQWRLSAALDPQPQISRKEDERREWSRYEFENHEVFDEKRRHQFTIQEKNYQHSQVQQTYLRSEDSAFQQVFTAAPSDLGDQDTLPKKEEEVRDCISSQRILHHRAVDVVEKRQTTLQIIFQRQQSQATATSFKTAAASDHSSSLDPNSQHMNLMEDQSSVDATQLLEDGVQNMETEFPFIKQQQANVLATSPGEIQQPPNRTSSDLNHLTERGGRRTTQAAAIRSSNEGSPSDVVDLNLGRSEIYHPGCCSAEGRGLNIRSASVSSATTSSEY